MAFDLLKATYWMEEAMQRTQQAMGMRTLSRAQCFLLANIGRGERRPARLARMLAVSRQTVSVLIHDLERLGILVVEPDPDHARANIVDFRADYAAEGKVIVEIFARIEEHLGTVIGADRLEVMRHALRIDWGEPPVIAIKNSTAKKKEP